LIYDTPAESVIFGNDPDSCDTRLDIAESDYTSAALFVGRTRSKNLASNTGDNVCRASHVPFIAKIQPNMNIDWLNYYTSSTVQTKFTAVRFSPVIDFLT